MRCRMAMLSLPTPYIKSVQPFTAMARSFIDAGNGLIDQLESASVKNTIS